MFNSFFLPDTWCLNFSDLPNPMCLFWWMFCYFAIFQLFADCKSNYKSRICCFHFANWIPIDKKRVDAKSQTFCQLKMCNELSTFALTMAFVVIFKVYVDWIGLVWNFSRIVDKSGCIFFSGFVLWFRLEFRTFNVYVENFFSKSTQFSIGTNQQISIDKRLFNKPQHFDWIQDRCWMLSIAIWTNICN